MREIMQGDYEVGTQDQLAELIFARHAVFIARMVGFVHFLYISLTYYSTRSKE